LPKAAEAEGKIMNSKSMIKRAGILVVCVAAAACASAADVKQNWEKHCLKCHGADGKGNTKMGKQSGVKDYTDPKVQAEMKEESALKIIKEGIVDKGKKKMDPYADKLSEQEIKELIAYMRAFKK
jgi:cytochrome c553